MITSGHKLTWFNISLSVCGCVCVCMCVYTLVAVPWFTFIRTAVWRISRMPKHEDKWKMVMGQGVKSNFYFVFSLTANIITMGVRDPCNKSISVFELHIVFWISHGVFRTQGRKHFCYWNTITYCQTGICDFLVSLKGLLLQNQ